MSVMASQINDLSTGYSKALPRFQWIKHKASHYVSFVRGRFPLMTGGFPSQRTSNAQRVVIMSSEKPSCLQGFCCGCDGNTAHLPYHARGGQDCTVANRTASSHTSAHCLKYHPIWWVKGTNMLNKQRVLMHGHQGWNVRHGLCHIYMIYVYIWVVYSFCLFCCLFIIVTTQFVALYKPCKPKPKFR